MGEALERYLTVCFHNLYRLMNMFTKKMSKLPLPALRLLCKAYFKGRGVYFSIYCVAHSSWPQDCSSKSPLQQQEHLLFLISGVSFLSYIAQPTLKYSFYSSSPSMPTEMSPTCVVKHIDCYSEMNPIL